MSHNLGTVQVVSPPLRIGPDTGQPPTATDRWEINWVHTAAPGGSKFLILHFSSVNLPVGHRLEVDLGYDMDTFTSEDGSEFWTRPVNVSAFASGAVPIRYLAADSTLGGVSLDRYGRGETLPGGANGITNCDPFLQNTSYQEPQYDDALICDSEPNWQNTDCVPSGDIRRDVAASVCMILWVEGDEVSSCSATCIGQDLVLTAGHCLAAGQTEVASASVIFNYVTDCDGSRPAGYQGRFFKVNRVANSAYELGVTDFSILQVVIPSGGLNVPARPMRASLPAIGEAVFMVHHPFGAVKKVSPLNTVSVPVLDVRAEGIYVSADAAVGSSGASLFDQSGHIVGVLSFGFGCSETFFASADLLTFLAAEPPNARDVMLVMDRSGSMAAATGTGRTKMVEARDAAALFVSLLRDDTGNRVGLATFSTTASTDFLLADVNPGNKTALIGNAPFDGGILGGISPGGTTTIGGGLRAALDQFPIMGQQERTILLLTDGLQNTPPLIETVEPQLAGIDVNAIGFGEAQNLDGALLSQLAGKHNGLYTRAGDPLDLKKFFSMTFGNIFESGTLADPRFSLAAGKDAAAPWRFPVCGEKQVTVIAGWDDAKSELCLRLETPNGTRIESSSKYAESATGTTWTFLRVSLPNTKAGDGDWSATVFRKDGSRQDLNYFLQVNAVGGASLRRIDLQTSYYTGDTVIPRVLVQDEGGGLPPNLSVTLTITAPESGLGNLLSKAGIGKTGEILGDPLAPRESRLQEIAEESERPLVVYRQQRYEMTNRDADTQMVGPPGLFGRVLPDLLTVEGAYTFHVHARYGDQCIGARELVWTLDVGVGIDPEYSQPTYRKDRETEDGIIRVIFEITPRDRFKNALGPGRGNIFDLCGQKGTKVAEPAADLGNGGYRAILHWQPKVAKQPAVMLLQSGRDPVAL